MIKKFEEYINEDYFSKLANRKDNNITRKENKITEDFVRSFVRKGYEINISSISFRKENGKTVVDINGNFYMRQDVEEIPFQFGKITGDFICAHCNKLTSFNGFPMEVGGDFSCSYCGNIASLKGCPQKVCGDFDCYFCENLTSLDDCPKEVGGSFKCNFCDILTSLKGCPQEVSGDFDCYGCGKKFTKDEIKSLCVVKGNIYV